MGGVARKNSKSFSILKALGVAGGVTVISLIAPASGAKVFYSLARAYFRKKRWERTTFLNDLRNLQKRQLIRYREFPNGEVEMTLTKRGKQEVLRYDLDQIRLDTKKPWDRKWRLVIFDIPHSKRVARDALRQKMYALGFYPLQKSVLLTPYECEKEIDFIASVFDVRDHILLMHVHSFEGEEKLKHHFDL